MATISNTPRPGYVWDATDNCWYPIGTGPHSHADYITAGSAINPNIVDAKGDLIAATAADTVARLAVGTNGQVLTAASTTATGLAWTTLGASVPANASATVTTSQTTTSDSYTDLATVGPTVTLTTGVKALVIVSAQMRNDTTNRVCYMSYEVSGATSISASDQVCLLFKNESSSGSQDLRASAASVVTLTAGSNTFTAKYKVNANTGTFINREISVINLA